MKNTRMFFLLAAIAIMAIISGCSGDNPTGSGLEGSCEDCPTEKPEEGPGEIKLAEDTVCSEADENTGEIIVLSVGNGYEAIWLEDEDGERVPGFYSDGFTPKEGQDHVFSTVPAGSYYVVAKRNSKESRSRLVTVDECEVEEDPPTAKFTWENDDLTISYDGSESSSPNGNIVEWAWDWTNDGEIDKRTDSPHVDHKFDRPGDEKTRLVVTDEIGLKDEFVDEVKPRAKDFGNIERLKKACYQFDGVISFSVENGVTGYRVTETGRNVVIEEADGLNPADNKKPEFDNLADVNHKLEIFRYNHEDSRSFSFDCDFNPDNYSWSHEFNGGFDESVWINSSQDHYIRDLASWGEYRPFLTEDGPVGEVVIEVQAQTDYPDKGHYAVVLCLDESCSDTITTPLYDFKVYEDGWVRGATKIDAGRLTNYARKYIRVRAVHGDEISNDKPDGSDRVTISIEGDVPIWSTTHWNTSSRAKGVGGEFVTNSQGEFEVRNETLVPYRN